MAINVRPDKDFEGAGAERPGRRAEGTILSSDLVAIDRDGEHFPFAYLPEHAQRLLREAFACYTDDLFLAFTIVARRAIAAAEHADGTTSRASFEQLFDDAATLGGIEASSRSALRAALFDACDEPAIDSVQAAALIEILKDMFLQRYARAAKLRRAIQVRRFFAREAKRRRSGA